MVVFMAHFGAPRPAAKSPLRTLIAVANGRFYSPLRSIPPRRQIAIFLTLIAVANGCFAAPLGELRSLSAARPSIFCGLQTLSSICSWRPNFRALGFLEIKILPYVSKGI